MQIKRIGLLEHRPKNFQISRPDNMGCYTFQLFHTPMHFIIGGESLTTQENTIILFGPQSAQFFHAAGDSMINDYVVFNADAAQAEGLVFDRPLHISNAELFHSLVQYMYNELYSANALRDETALHLLQALLSKCREVYSDYKHTESIYAINEKFLQLHNDIRTFPAHEWTVDEMAERCALSASRFHAVYKQMFSISPMADVLHVRMITAQNLLKSSMHSVKEIAFAVGYSNDVHFMMQFKKKTGLTPSQYRKKHRA